MINKYFPLPLIGKFIGKGEWKLQQPFKYVNPPVEVNVPIGFVSDGASIPKIAYSFIGSPWGGKYAEAAVIHDFGYVAQTMKRYQVDKAFYTGMRLLGVSRWKASLMYFFVKSLGWYPWNKRKGELL